MSKRSRMMSRRAAKVSIRQEKIQRRVAHSPSLTAAYAAQAAQRTTQLQSLINVQNGVRVAGLPTHMASMLFNAGANAVATLQSISHDQAIIRTSRGTFAVQRKFVKAANDSAAKKREGKSLSLSYSTAPTRRVRKDTAQWRQVVPGLYVKS